MSDHADYSAYNKVYPQIEDRNLTDGEFLEQDNVNANLYKFIDTLPDDYEEKQ